MPMPKLEGQVFAQNIKYKYTDDIRIYKVKKIIIKKYDNYNN